MKILFIIAIIVLTFVACKKEKVTPPPQPEPAKYGSISGVVTDNYGTPIANARLQANPSKLTVETDAFGHYELDSVIVGDYSVIASAENFISKKKDTSIVESVRCVIDFKLKTGKATLKINSDTLKLHTTGKSDTVSVVSNSSWTVTSKTPWINIKTSSGEGNDDFAYEYTGNSAFEVREGVIEISTGDTTKKIVVIQNSDLTIISQTDPSTVLLTDSITVIFNKKVSLTSIVPNYEFCLPTIGYRYIDNGKGVRFKYSCANLGGSYPFTISVKDNFSESFTRKFNVTYYKAKLHFEASIEDMYVSDDNKICWVAIHNQYNDGTNVDKIIGLSLPDLTVVKEHVLNFKINNIFYNRYNKLLYITNDDAPEIYKMNLNTGAIADKVIIKPLPKDVSLYPAITPSNIYFSDNGLGIVVVRAKGTSIITWRIIDSSSGDKMSFHSLQNTNSYLINICTNFDRSVFYLRDEYSKNDLFMLDAKTRKAQRVILPIKSYIGWINPSAVNNNVLIQQLDQQYLYNPVSKQAGVVTHLGYGNAAFSYKPGEESLVYSLQAANSSSSVDYVSVLDFKNNTQKLKFPAKYGLNGYNPPISTTDGKYLVVRNYNDIHVFSTEMFTP